MTDLITATDIQLLRNKLAQAEADYASQRKATRQEVTTELAQIVSDIRVLEQRAEKLAESADLVFYYSGGYEEYTWVNKEDWSESSRYC